MSEINLTIIPKDFKQDLPAIDFELIKRKLKNVFPGADDIEIKTFSKLNFFTQGATFEKVSCNECRKELNKEWWQSCMDKACKKEYEDLTCECPKCKQLINLNELNYEVPSGFAKFSIDVVNPKITEQFNIENIREFYSLLNCELKQIWTFN